MTINKSRLKPQIAFEAEEARITPQSFREMLGEGRPKVGEVWFGKVASSLLLYEQES